jgi:hypothetical protein
MTLRISNILVGICTIGASLSVASLVAHAQSCRIEVPIAVELHTEEFTFADLLPADTCAPFYRRASQVRLGKVPLEGIARILDGSDLRERLQSIARVSPGNFAVDTLNVPERITVTRSAIPASCEELINRVLPNPHQTAKIDNTHCGVATEVPANARLELAKKSWDPALRSWELVARCTDPKSCVPFFIRIPDDGENKLSDLRHTTYRENAAPNLVVHPGQRIEVIWNQSGLRLRLPGVAVEPGRTGDKVRVHLKAGPVITAVVSSPGTLLWPQ